jgi:hypothetical protein
MLDDRHYINSKSEGLEGKGREGEGREGTGRG